MYYTDMTPEQHKLYRDEIMKLHRQPYYDNPQGHDALHLLLMKLDREMLKREGK